MGAAGYGWNGDAVMQFRRKWPVWKAPDSMIERRPEFAPYSVANGGMPGGPGNPLGARALYLFQNKQDTLYRIHGACEPKYLGQAVSSGCIRLLDQDVIDLHDRVQDGAKVIVLASTRYGEFEALYFGHLAGGFKLGALGGHERQLRLHRAQRSRRNRHHPLLVALAHHDGEGLRRADGVPWQRNQLGRPQARAV